MESQTKQNEDGLQGEASSITPPRWTALLLISCMFLSGYCGIISELSLFNLGTVLLGGTNTTLAYTMGLMMFFMGFGALITETRLFKKVNFVHFAWIEMTLSLLCMIAVPFIHYYSGLYPRHVLYFFLFFSPLIGGLIGMEIPIIMRLNQSLGLRLQENSARVMMADYFGSLMAFMLFPFLLFPKLGIGHAALSGAFVNLSVALIALVYFRKHIKYFRTSAVLFCLLFGFSIYLWTQLDGMTRRADELLYRDPILLNHNTEYQKLVITQKNPFKIDRYTKRSKEPGKLIFKSQDERFELKKFEESFDKDIRFFINGGLQFSTVDEYRYHEMLVHPAMHLKPEVTRVLVLGGGDGLAVRELLKYTHIKEVVLVDLDRELTDLFRYSELAKLNDFAFQDERVRIINHDAFLYLRTLQETFQIILIDFPDPYSIHTAKLYSRQFYNLVKRSMSDDGILCLQSTSPLFNRKTFVSIGNTLENVGFKTLPMKVNMKTFEDWGFYLCSKTVEITKLKKSLHQYKERVPTRYLNQEVMISNTLFGKDIFHDRHKIPYNDLHRLILVQLYRDGDL